MIKNLRKSQKIILLIAFIIVFYFMIHPQYDKLSYGVKYLQREWIWDTYSHLSINYSDMIMNISIVAVATVIFLFIESLIYSNKKED